MGAQAHEWRRRNEGGSHPGAILIFVDSRIVCVAQPKSWTELQAGIECLTQLLALLEVMASTNAETPAGEELHEAAVLLQQQLVYNGQVLDAALDGLRVYKDGTQSLMFLRSSVHLAYSLMRMLEKWAKTTGDGSYVRKRVKPKKKRKAKGACEFLLFLFSVWANWL